MKRIFFFLLLTLFFGASAFAAEWWNTAEFGGSDSYTVALWHFNENAGTTADDVSANANDLTLSNVLAWDAVNKKYGASALGNDAAYTATNATLLDSPPVSLSVGGWFYPAAQIDNTLAASKYLVGKDNSLGNDSLYFYFPALDGTLRLVANGTGGPADCDVHSTTSTWLAATWYWVQATWSVGAGARLYVNGVLEGSNATCNVMMADGTTHDFYLGSNAVGTSVFNGVLDEWMVSNVDRNASPMGVAPAAGDLNVLRVDGYDANATPFFSYSHDGNLTIDFNVTNADNNTVFLDLNYSSTNVQGTGTRIFEDLKLIPANDLNGGFNQVFDSNKYWSWLSTYDVNSVIVDTTMKYSGSSSIKAGVVSRFSVGTSAQIYYNVPGTWNLTDWNSGYAEFYVYMPNNAVFTRFDLILRGVPTTLNTVYYKNSGEFVLDAWNYVRFKLGDWNGAESGGLKDFNTVDAVIFRAVGTGTGDNNYSFWVDDFRLLPGTTNPCITQIWKTTPSTCSIDWNINSNLVADGNYFLLFDLNRSTFFPGGAGTTSFFKASGKTVGILNNPLLRFHLFDENTLSVIHTAQATLEGTTYYAGADGNITIPYYGFSGEKIVSIGDDGNYATRNFYINFGTFSNNRDINAFLVKDTNGQSISFEFYSEDGLTKLTSEVVTVIKDMNAMPVPDVNIASIVKLSDGKATLFLNPDANYVFKVNGIYYYKVAGTVQLPKNEGSLAVISPFDLTVSGIGSVQWLANATAVTHYFLPNTVSSYIFDVNAGIGYYNRSYFVSAKGNPHAYSLQPYLVQRADGIQSVFFVRNSYSAAGLPGIRITSQKNIPTQGTVTIEEVVTDSAGEGVLSFITDDTYYLYFYADGSLVYNIELRPTSTSYQVYLDLETFSIPDTNFVDMNVFFYPYGGIAFEYADGNVDLNQRIVVSGARIGNVRVFISNAGRTIYDVNFDGNAANWQEKFFQQRFNPDLNLDDISPIKITVTVRAGTITRVFAKSYSIEDYNKFGTNLFALLKNSFPLQFGGGQLIFIAIFIAVIVMGAAAIKITTDPNGIGLIGILTLAPFVYLEWVPLIPFVLACIAFLAIFILQKRVEY